MNMRLSEKAIKDLKEIYFKEYGKTISDEEAQDLGERLISLFKIIYRPIPGKDTPSQDSHFSGKP
ncbi:MAG: hypothetical protein PHU81_01745 [Acidobacteriota bacterium]|nr:hypothetical protein [Acidobacteriota bacterium]